MSESGSVNPNVNKSRVFGLKTGFLRLAFPAKLRYSLVNKGLTSGGWSRLYKHSLFYVRALFCPCSRYVSYCNTVVYENIFLPKNAKARKKRARLRAQNGTSKSPVFRAKFFGENGNFHFWHKISGWRMCGKTERFW